MGCAKTTHIFCPGGETACLYRPGAQDPDGEVSGCRDAFVGHEQGGLSSQVQTLRGEEMEGKDGG